MQICLPLVYCRGAVLIRSETRIAFAVVACLGLAACSTTSTSPGQLNYAVSSDDLQSIRTQIADGANVNARADDGTMPLHFAASKGNLAISKELVQAGAEINVADCGGKTPLMWAAKSGSIAVSRYLLQQGADINRRGGEANITCNHGHADDTPLSIASQYNHPDLVRFMLDRGAEKGWQRAFAYALADPAREPVAGQLKAKGYRADEETARMVASLGSDAKAPGVQAAESTQTADASESSDDPVGDIADTVGGAATLTGGAILLQTLLGAAL